jgi:glycosyltransferase involved in cell wall biosynthesis
MQATSPRTIVFLESAAAMGGVQFSTLYLAQTLDRARWNPIVVCPREGQLTRACRDAGIEAHVIEWPRLWSTSVRVSRTIRMPNPFAWIWNAMVILRAVRLVHSFLQKRAPNVVMTKGLASHFVGGLAARRLRIPCVWHVQDLISERNLGLYRRVFSFAARRLPARIIVDGTAIKHQLPQSIHSRVAVIHNGVDTSLFNPDRDGSSVRRELAIARDQFVIGHAGRITPWKGQHYLIEAFARIAPEYPNAVLLFVGSPVFDHDGYERRLRAMAAGFGLKHRIIFASYRHDLAHVFSAMDIFAFTSIEKDTSPLVLLSAMSNGLPIVAFDIEGVRELVENSQSLMLVPVANAEELAQSLRSLIESQQLRLRLSQAARRAAETKFNLNRYVSRIESELIQACSPGEAIGACDPFDDHRRIMAASSGQTSPVSAIGS